MGVITEYIDAAMREAQYEDLGDGEGFAGVIPELEGLIGHASNLEECKEDLREALEGWLLVSFRLNLPIPVKNGLDLQVVEREVA